MPNPITTTGTTSDPITTNHQSGQSISEWVEDHDKDVEASTPSGGTLTTTWTSGSGAQTKTTERIRNESDVAFVNRHIQEYLVLMLEETPLP